jgi:hypothetical protein
VPRRFAQAIVYFLALEKNTNTQEGKYVRFEVFAAVIMRNGVFWDVTPRGSRKNRRFGGT